MQLKIGCGMERFPNVISEHIQFADRLHLYNKLNFYLTETPKNLILSIVLDSNRLTNFLSFLNTVEFNGHLFIYSVTLTF